jgi:hypothetical protein
LDRDQPVARPLPTHRTTQSKRKQYRHLCLQWDSNSRSQRPSEQSQFMPQSARPPWSASSLTWIALVTPAGDYVLKSCSLCRFLQPPTISCLFSSNSLLSALFSNTFSLRSSLNVRDQGIYIYIYIYLQKESRFHDSCSVPVLPISFERIKLTSESFPC